MKCPNTSCEREMRIVQHKLWKDIFYYRCDNCKARVYDSIETVKSITDRNRGIENSHAVSAEGLRRKESLFDEPA